jgi:cation-transporting ATPase 13A3/4/5
MMDDGGFHPGKNYQLAIVRRFDFSSKVMRSSIIVKNFLDNSFRGYIKGSPEKIRELCLRESIPDDYEDVLQEYTERGFRVLAMAHKPLPGMTYIKTQKCERDTVENDIFFLGFLIMQNKLKAATTGTIQTLNAAKIRTIMATGDNVLTAIAVGRECNIMDPQIEVFLGDLVSSNGVEKVVFKSTKQDNHRLNPGTLEPNKKFFED